MSNTFSKKPLALALGAAFSLTAFGAQASVFQTADLASGYMVAQATPATPAEGKGGEAKCGAACMKEKMEKGKMSEADAKAHCDKMAKEGKCGEGKCGADKDKAKAKEGKCGEGKCGGKK
ncbi:MAG: HvfA family oxazolone/thioamide-modified RiPP metallophore [Nevskiaceae bacterium]